MIIGRWILWGLAFVTTLAVAQQREYRDPRNFPFNEAVQEPAAVIFTQQSTNWYGDHPPGTNDPLFRAQELLGRPTDTSVTINVEAVEEVEAYFEYGTWGFDEARPGWAMPIHQLLVAHNATIYFHGHDHLYVKQDLDGIVYQEGPVPARSGRHASRRYGRPQLHDRSALANQE